MPPRAPATLRSKASSLLTSWIPRRPLSSMPWRRQQGDVAPDDDEGWAASAEWPLLKTRTRARRCHVSEPGFSTAADADADVSLAQPSPLGQALADLGHEADDGVKAKTDPRLMLVLHGLSPNLNPSDFYRLGSDQDWSWQRVIKKVQQQRHRDTLEPLGCYQVSFDSAAAAAAYRDTLDRLHRLSRHKLLSPTGLWESCVPLFLRSPTAVSPAAELAGFTLVAASQPAVNFERKRVKGKQPWSTRLLARVAPFAGPGERPPVVLLHVYPPTLDAPVLSRFIEADGAARGCPWRVSNIKHLEAGLETPSHLPRTTSTVAKHFRTLEKQKSRFVVVCATDAEARRFHRRWNQLTLTTGQGSTVSRNLVHASIIKW
ncbi:hypothetical protein G6O67_000544 [Ophiocordyceps sinensis]|uniref:Uncharacterized protein n=1 Tax=Ophiocordyceps sinensis TaxID=72228 RepID=A0A8H4VA35_9HYPO|nr:hypothetical protein G6O67_000544 [Ophiocordyceps sinensis]